MLIVFFHVFCCWLIFFQSHLYQHSVKQFDPDQDQYVVGSDLGSNGLQRLSADDTSRQRVKVGMVFGTLIVLMIDSEHCFILANSENPGEMPYYVAFQ